MSMAFGEAERYIHSFFPTGRRLIIENKEYEVIQSGKPTTSRGEPKTDIYILLKDTNNYLELKISVKKNNADFLENKTSAQRAEQIFGRDWMEIVIDSTTQLVDRFYSKPLIFKESYKRTEAGAITLGWKFELLNKVSGELSGVIALSKEQMMGIYAGTTLGEDKKNASVNGKVIENSGIANTILFGDLEKFQSAEQVLNSLVLIEKYVEQHPSMYFACKALNYRTFKKKYDGDRPLAVFIDWKNLNGKLHPEFVFDKPLFTKGNEVAMNLLRVLDEIGINDTDDINSFNVTSLDYVND